MKPTDFIKEDFVTDAHEAHQDHEVQMARSDCYNAAKYAIELHKMLKNITEQQGLEGWVSEKITIANDYLRTVHEYLTYEQMSHASIMPGFEPEVAEMHIESVVREGEDPHAWMQDMKAMAHKMYPQDRLPAKKPEPVKAKAVPQRKGPPKSKEEIAAGIRQQMADYYADNNDTRRHIGDSYDPNNKDVDEGWVKNAVAGAALVGAGALGGAALQSHGADTHGHDIKKPTVSKVAPAKVAPSKVQPQKDTSDYKLPSQDQIDKRLTGGYKLPSPDQIDKRLTGGYKFDPAKAEVPPSTRRYNENAGSMGASSVATAPAKPTKETGTLFGGSYKQKTPKRESVIKR